VSEDAPKADPDTKTLTTRFKRRWYQYSLRSLFILTTLACIGMGLLVVPVHRARQQRAAIEALRKLGWVVTCGNTPSGPGWARWVFGDEMFLDAVAVDSSPGASDDAMAHLSHMPHLERVFVSGDRITDAGAKHLAGLRNLKIVCFSGTQVTDAGLRYFERLENLEQLYLTRTQVTEQGVWQLEELLPDCRIWRLQEQTNSIGMQFVLIPAGEFMMGSPKDDEYALEEERPRHRVRLTKPFYLGVTEVTQEQYATVMGSRPWSGNSYVKKGEDCPATYVNCEDAVAFCEKLSAKEGRTYRLPTEAQWEYACRAGSTTSYCFGDDSLALGNYAWYGENAEEVGKQYPHAVGRKKPNGWGLCGMHGNVSEWCEDWCEYDYYQKSPESDPPGPSTGSHRVFRGGSWSHPARYCRSADRDRYRPAHRSNYLGFRVACSPADE